MNPEPKEKTKEEEIVEEKKEEPKHYVLEVQDSIMDSKTIMGEQ